MRRLLARCGSRPDAGAARRRGGRPDVVDELRLRQPARQRDSDEDADAGGSPPAAAQLVGTARRPRVRAAARGHGQSAAPDLRRDRGGLGLCGLGHDRQGRVEARARRRPDARVRHVGHHVDRRDRPRAAPALRDQRRRRPARARSRHGPGGGGLSAHADHEQPLRVRLGRPADRERPALRRERVVLRRRPARRPVPGGTPDLDSARTAAGAHDLGSRSRPGQSRRHVGLGRHLGRPGHRPPVHRRRELVRLVGGVRRATSTTPATGTRSSSCCPISPASSTRTIQGSLRQATPTSVQRRCSSSRWRARRSPR